MEEQTSNNSEENFHICIQFENLPTQGQGIAYVKKEAS